MSTQLEIRSIESGDWPGIDRVQRASFPPSAIENMAALRSIVNAAPEFCSVAVSDEAVVGYLLSHPWMADDLPALNEPLRDCADVKDTLFIHDMAIVPSARDGGLASRMVQSMLDHARERELRHAALISVQDTVKFWSRFGFVERPDLTERFRARVAAFTEIPFQFMAAELAPGYHFAT
ncbi:MAG: GNAT family N-acetyltransferase [Chthoniobacterales bacterium]